MPVGAVPDVDRMAAIHPMRFLTFILLLSLNGCFTESYFKLAPDSLLPGGLDRDLRLAPAFQPHVKIWFYTYDPVAVKVFDGHHYQVFECHGTWRSATSTDAPVSFFVTINGVETGYRRVGPDNTIAAVPPGG
jgi:hypothetical protein